MDTCEFFCHSIFTWNRFHKFKKSNLGIFRASQFLSFYFAILEGWNFPKIKILRLQNCNKYSISVFAIQEYPKLISRKNCPSVVYDMNEWKRPLFLKIQSLFCELIFFFFFTETHHIVMVLLCDVSFHIICLESLYIHSVETSITQILFRINFWDSKSAKSAILTHLEALNFDFLWIFAAAINQIQRL